MANLVDVIEGIRSSLVSEESLLREAVLSTGRLSDISKYQELIRFLHNYVSSGGVIENLLKKMDNTVPGKKPVEESRPASPEKSGKVWINYDEAVEYWKEQDKSAGRKVIGDHSYTIRISRAVKKGVLESQRKGKRFTSFEKTSLDKAIGSIKYSKGGSSDEKGYDNRAAESDWISPHDAIQLYRRIETEAPHINNSETTDIAYQNRVRRMINKKKVKVKGKGRHLLIDRSSLLESIHRKHNGKHGSGSSYDSFVKLVDGGMNKYAALNSLKISGRSRGAYLGAYSKYQKSSGRN